MLIVFWNQRGVVDIIGSLDEAEKSDVFEKSAIEVFGELTRKAVTAGNGSNAKRRVFGCIRKG